MRHHFQFPKALFILLLCCISISVLHAQKYYARYSARDASHNNYKAATVKESASVSGVIKEKGTDSAGCSTPLNGTYYVGDSTSDFQSIDDAIQYLTTYGVSGPVRMLITNGFRLGFSITDTIPGSSSKNCVTFRSASGRRDSVKFIQVKALRLCNTAHLRFEEISFEGTVIGLEMDSSLTDVEFHNCNIIAPAQNNSIYRAVNYPGASTTSKLNGIRFISDTIKGGFYTIYLNAPNSGSELNDLKCQGLTFDSNVICDGIGYGLYLYQYGIIKSFSHNIVTNCTEMPQFSYYGIYSNQNKRWGVIDGNRICIKNKSKGYGIYFTENNNYQNSESVIVCNNEVILSDSDSKYGIYLSNPNGNWEIVNNSILTHSTSTSYGLYLYNTIQNYKITTYNNMCVNGKNNGYPIYISGYTNSNYHQRDYNNYSSGGANLAYFGSAKNTLKAIQLVDTTLDQHSTIFAPEWVDSSKSLEIKNSKFFTCPPYPNIKSDINGLLRNGTQTLIGCYGKETDSIDAYLLAFADMDKLTSTAASPVKAVILNNGIKGISTATVILWIDNVKKATVAYTPQQPLPFMGTDTVNLGNFQLSNGLHHFMAQVQLANDADSNNNSITYDRYVCSSQVKGTFVIGNSKNADYPFQNMGTLFTRINDCGVDGDITIAFEDGSYVGSIDLSSIAEAMGKHHLTLTSVAKDRDKVTIADSNNILILGSYNKNVTVENLTFQKLKDVNNTTVIMLNGCSDIKIRNNKMLMDSNANSGYHIISQASQHGNIHNVSITSNLMQGGYNGIYINGFNRDDKSENIVIDSNEMYNQKRYAVNLYYTYAKSVSHNVILSRRNSSDNFTGINISSCQADSIIGNYVDAARDTVNQLGTTGLYLNYLNYYSGTTTLVANNCILAKVLGGYQSVYISYSSIKFYHNTIRAIAINKNNGGFVIYVINAAKEENRLIGNIIDATNAECAMFTNINANSKKTITDYNSYSNIGGKYLIRVNNTYCNNLSEIQAATLADTHSIQQAPVYKNLSKDLEILASPQQFMPRLDEVKYDITGKARFGLTTMGAYESTGEQNDAALIDFSKTTLVNGSSSPVYVSLMNLGSNPLTSATIRWIANGVSQTPVNWTGNLTSRTSTDVLLGNIIPTKFNTLVAWVEKPNSQNDANPTNDTIRLQKYLCSGQLSGSYTVGGYNPSFTNLEEMTETLYNCGVSGPVTISFRTGNYGTLHLSDTIPGTNATNTVTFNTAKGESPIFGKDTGAVFENIQYTIFQNLTFGDTTDGTIGVQMKGNCSHVTFRECNIYASVTTKSQSMAFSYPNSSNSNLYPVEVKLTRNNIAGGYYNIYLYYLSGSASNMIKSSLYIDSNVLKDAYYCGIYAYYYAGIPSISHNSISSRLTSGNDIISTYYAIYSYYYKNLGQINGNRIDIRNVDFGYGMYFSYYQNHPSYSFHSAMVTNNEIRVQGNKSQYGMSVTASYSRMDVHHNSVYTKSKDATANAYGLHLMPSTITNSEDRFHFTRNLLVTDGATNYPIYFRNKYFGKEKGLREWNNLYSATNVGYVLGKAVTSVAEYQDSTKQDAHTLSILPPFADLSKGLALKDYDTLHCPKIDSVSTDIEGHQRNASTNIGCYASAIVTQTYHVTLHTNDSTMGKVSGGGDYASGSIAKLTATAEPKHHFEKWDDGNRENPRQITVTRDVELTAIFAPDDGISDVQAKPLSLYPNPAKQSLFLTNGERYENIPYEITDVTGRMVLQGNYNASEGIHVGNLAKGVYLLRLEGRFGRFVKE